MGWYRKYNSADSLKVGMFHRHLYLWWMRAAGKTPQGWNWIGYTNTGICSWKSQRRQSGDEDVTTVGQLSNIWFIIGTPRTWSKVTGRLNGMMRSCTPRGARRAHRIGNRLEGWNLIPIMWCNWPRRRWNDSPTNLTRTGTRCIIPFKPGNHL